MPLEEGCDKETISRNIAKLIKDEGYEREQAVAIAMDKCKDYTPADEPLAIPRPTQTDVHYLLKSVTKDASCDGCRWFTKDYCHIVENSPEDITGAGYCDRHEAKAVDTPTSEPPGPDPQPVPVPEDVVPAPEDSAMGYIAPDSNGKSFLRTLKEKLSGGLHPGNVIFKGADGKRYMFIITSNSFQDRDKEYLTAHSLADYVNASWKAADYFQSNNPQLVWHHDSLPVGDIVWADMAGPFLIEVARERGGIVAKTAYDYWEANKDALGASFRFKYRLADRDADGTYHRIVKTETSTLPREAAANLLTFSGVLPMDTRNQYLDKMFGIEGVAELLKEGPEKLAAALEAKGVQHKAVDKDPVAETEKAETTFGALLMQMIDSQTDILKEFDGMKAALETAEQTRTKEMAQYAESFKALEARNAQLEAELKLSPRASVAPETALSGDAKKAAENEIAAKQVDSKNGLDRYIRQVEGR